MSQHASDKSSKRSPINPILQAALGSLDLQLEEEIARYRHQQAKQAKQSSTAIPSEQREKLHATSAQEGEASESPQKSPEQQKESTKGSANHNWLTPLKVGSVLAALAGGTLLGAALFGWESLSPFESKLSRTAQTNSDSTTPNQKITETTPEREPSTHKSVDLEITPPPNPEASSSSSPTPRQSQPSSPAANVLSAPQSSNYYYVLVDYAGDRSLEQAQKIVPGAFVRDFPTGTQIQMGAFKQESGAQALAERLNKQGISAFVEQL
ncbi:MAG: hypothetical protein BRC44_10450 [Cyanobacteria bacterium QS_4_48_99]|jgi:cell division protein FtsN|nr:MAG: hypothetical protein BRC44_10450 [Cyanobacteria bacterium QS_4_48_99]PSP36460.1 MAG: hypothetical protein BRC57_01620 [Cyanobacteria bacterium QS_8_48_54]